MCFARKPNIKQIKPPAPVLAPLPANKPAEVTRKPKKLVKSDGKTRKRGTQRSQMVIPPSGVNRGSGGTGVYN